MKIKSALFASAMLLMISVSAYAEMSPSARLDCLEAKKALSNEAFNLLKKKLAQTPIEVWCPQVMAFKKSAKLEAPVNQKPTPVPVRLEQTEEIQTGAEGAI